MPTYLVLIALDKALKNGKFVYTIGNDGTDVSGVVFTGTLTAPTEILAVGQTFSMIIPA